MLYLRQEVVSMTLGSRIKALRQDLEMTLEDVALKVGVTRATIQKYENGIIGNIPSDKIELLAKALNTTPAYLMGWEQGTNVDTSTLPSNVTPLRPMRKVPLVGQIACGTPILAEQNIEDYIDLPGHIHADYALTCKGDSMVNAGIRDGDVVYIREQPEVETGQIAAVIVGDDEATLKRFYYDGSMIQLVAENPRVPPMVFSGSEVSRVRVLGLAVAYTHILD